MSFPYHVRTWREAGEFLQSVVRPGDRVLAPDPFWWLVSRVERFVPANLVPERPYDWVVVDLNDLAQFPRPFIEGVASAMVPVFVNEVFVVWAADGTHAPPADVLSRLAGFWAMLAKLLPEPEEPNRYAQDPALADAPVLARFADLSDAELRASQNDFYRRTGYRYPTRRDQAYHDDVRGHVAGAVHRWAGGRVLELCAGAFRFPDLPEGTLLVRTELAEVGLRMARTEDGPERQAVYGVADAHRVCFPDATFDGVLFVDSIEHVRDAARVLEEAARVLTGGGELLVSFANRDSVNQVITRKLGYPEFVTNHQHIREFTFDEIRDLLTSAGFGIVETAGVSLYPYWGVPGIDGVVRHLTDDDPEVVALMRELGARVGADYAYTGVVLARKHGHTASSAARSLPATTGGA
ncbi:MAG: methyltransferase domain-containing protein [Actinobacteria bacterium]|nr:methyltransferase domain-containing protein [Actinomycetota bacterium]